MDGNLEPRGNLSVEIRGGAAVQRTSLEGGAHGDLSRRSLREMRKDPGLQGDMGTRTREVPASATLSAGSTGARGPEATTAEPSPKISTPTSPHRPGTAPGSQPCGPELCAEVPGPAVHSHGATACFQGSPHTQPPRCLAFAERVLVTVIRSKTGWESAWK